MESEFWAAVIGAVVGGGLAGAVQYMTIRHQKSEEDRRRRENSQALGRGLVFKLMRIVTVLRNLHVHIDEARSRVPEAMHDEPWTYVLPIANLPETVRLTSEEVSLVMLSSVAIMNNLLDIESVHDSSLQVMRKYGELRQALVERLPISQSQDQVVTSALSREQIEMFRPRMIELNTLINALGARSLRDYERAKDTLIDVGGILASRYGIKFDFHFEPV